MNELQISLLVIGLLIVAGVYAFNCFQERKFRRIAEKAFPARREDVLLKDEGDTLPDACANVEFREESRIEPIVSAPTDEIPVESVEHEPELKETTEKSAPFIQSPIEAVESMPNVSRQAAKPIQSLDETVLYIVQLHLSEPVIGTTALFEAIRRQGDFGKRVHWLGMNVQSGGWDELGQGDTEEYHQIAATLQLADRSGPVSDPDLAIFCSQVQTVADELVAIAKFPGRQPALALATALDEFCADVDVLIGVNIITRDGVAFAATKVRALAESAGMELQPDGAFHFFNDEGADLFSLANLDPPPFSAENIRQFGTHGITFLFDVPRVADGVRVFNQMLMVARQMATSLGGQVVDDNRKPLSDTGVARIKEQLEEIYARMEQQQIKSGSARALRLFS